MKQYLGFDSSTQGLKAVIIDEHEIIAEESVNFGKNLPEYHSPNGFLEHDDPEICHADPLLWLAALDLLLQRMQKKGIDLSRIAGISGSGQQHGSVYLNACFESVLNTLDPGKTLAEQIAPALSRKTAPIWRDHSTTKQCKDLKTIFGDYLQHETGSAATERFTGPQIMKFAQEEPIAWQQTVRVHLVSSFLCSALCGKSAPVDYGDGAGMNLLNLKTLQWDPAIAGFIASDLAQKLPAVVKSGTIAGTLSPYFRKYGFSAGIPVTVWSGDNPCSIVGLGVFNEETIGISLGTSDTVFAAMHEFKTDPVGCGHVFGNPAGGFLSLICFANGSLAREKLRAGFDFTREEWENAVKQTNPASGKIMLPYFEPECTPPLSSPLVKCNFDETAVPAETIRALLETQILSMKYHSNWMNLNTHKIRLTGGASKSMGLCQIIADIFQADAELLESSNSAGTGAAMCAANAIEGIPFSCLAEHFCHPMKTIHPIAGNLPKYERMMQTFSNFLESLELN